MKVHKRKKVAGSSATYLENGSLRCDLVELSKLYRYVGNIPERVGWVKACEIANLADAFLVLYKKRKPAPKRKGRR